MAPRTCAFVLWSFLPCASASSPLSMTLRAWLDPGAFQAIQFVGAKFSMAPPRQYVRPLQPTAPSRSTTRRRKSVWISGAWWGRRATWSTHPKTVTPSAAESSFPVHTVHAPHHTTPGGRSAHPSGVSANQTEQIGEQEPLWEGTRVSCAVRIEKCGGSRKKPTSPETVQLSIRHACS